MFFQADNTVDHAKGGMGLGLTLVKRIAEAHGGRVEATSHGKDQGSAFVVVLPLAAPAQLSGESASSPPSGSLRSRKVLIVEDNEDSRRMLGEILRLAHHEVRLAEDGLRGLEAAREFRPEIAIIDIGLPTLSGYDVARKIRTEILGKDVFLIALTGYGGEADREQAKEAGFDAHLVKPIQHEELARFLNGEVQRAGEIASEINTAPAQNEVCS